MQSSLPLKRCDGIFSSTNSKDGSRYSRSHLQCSWRRCDPLSFSEKVCETNLWFSYIFIQAKDTFRNRWSFRKWDPPLKHILRIFGMFAAGKEEESTLTMFTPELNSLETRLSIAVFISWKLLSKRASHSSSPWQWWWNLSSNVRNRNLITIRGKWGGNKCSSSTRPDATANLYWL